MSDQPADGCGDGIGMTLPPQPFEPVPGNSGVVSRVLGIAVSEVVPHRSQIGARAAGGWTSA